jgi:hypothetical protein
MIDNLKSNWVYIVYVEKENYIIHENYDEKIISNDIALIKVPTIPELKNVAKIKLAPKDMALNDRIGFITGFGRTDTNGTSPRYLQFGQMRIVNDFYCHYIGYDPKTLLCAREIDGQNTCGG